MKKYKSLMIKFGGLITAITLVIGVASTTAQCLLFFHQPKIPPSMNKYK